MHLVETFLLGRNFIRNSSVANEANIPQELSFSKIDLSFGLRSTADETMRVPFAPPSLIIALDATFNPNNPSVYSLRSTYSAADGQLTPVIRLIIAKSSEHIERCLPPADGMEALRFLVQHTEELSEIYSPYNESNDFQSDDAERVVQFVNSKASRRRWHLPCMSPPEEWIQTEEEEQSHDNHPTLTIGEKRPLAAECDAEAKTAKKRKIASSWHEIIRLSGTTKKKSTSRPSQALKTSTVDSVTAKPDTIIQQLRSELAESRSSLTRYQSEFARLQHRYETKHNDYHKMRQSLNASLDSNKRLEHELQRLKQDNAALRDERVGLRNDLEALKEIKKSEDQMQRDLIEAKEEAAKLQKENASLKRQTDQERSQAEYTRIQYQNASSAAAKAAMENKQLEDRIKLLQDQMAGRALELKQMRLNNNEKVHLARIAELEALLDSRERMLGIREEELRELKKNRPSTRATSVQPRSVARSHSPGGYGSNGHSNGSGTGPSLKGPSNILRYR
ncbi:Histone deacetylase complex, subunit 2/3 [Ascosphaera apis ARSEF 7405]|uniref:Histone deacetylase complex, subunit 2/3 n=1 Tax=Ascosphaera apis ARSEF 7405 TaxID=392613 RepID=A0A166NMB3_9EURO|nr:Histone deacetylase complex, subunit 2/3 [Ascosphaera apis ARSEF 7405]